MSMDKLHAQGKTTTYSLKRRPGRPHDVYMMV
jgi:hypothetical protein